MVEVLSSERKYLATGHFLQGSIAVKLFSFTRTTAEYDFWLQRLKQAWELRMKLGLTDSNLSSAYRLVFSEGDGLPGLIIDWYNGVAVIQSHSPGMHNIKPDLVDALKEIYQEKLVAVYDKSAKTLPFKADIEAKDGYLFGKSSAGEVIEYGNRFNVDWEEGQKTGFFIDQRENRKLLSQYAKGKDVLNMFCYTGGFSFSAMQGGAHLVHSVDSSVKAIALTNRNVELNYPGDTRHEAFVADAFDYMQDIKDKYDLIILDPPAFAKHRGALSQALQGYKRLNANAFRQIKPGGILFTFSCSQVVTRNNFREAVFSAAAIAGREVRILHQLSQPVDHPINIYHPEGEYLKGLVLYVS